MPEEILSLIKSSNRENAEKKQLKKKSVWLIFTIGNQADGKNLYAIPADSVKEILRDATVFPLPFVPPYVNGVLNRYGDPYVVIDSAVLEGKEAQHYHQTDGYYGHCRRRQGCLGATVPGFPGLCTPCPGDGGHGGGAALLETPPCVAVLPGVLL